MCLCGESRTVARLASKFLIPNEGRIPDHGRIRSVRLGKEEVGDLDPRYATSLGHRFTSDLG